MKKYLLNISSGAIHDGINTCKQGLRTAEFNQKWFNDYQEAKNFFEGKGKQGKPCGICFKGKDIN